MVVVYCLESIEGKFCIGKSTTASASSAKQRVPTGARPIGSANDFISEATSSNEWTDKYRPIRVVELIGTTDNTDVKSLVDDTVIRYMQKYGIDNVRGGSFSDCVMTCDQGLAVAKLMKERVTDDHNFTCSPDSSLTGTLMQTDDIQIKEDFYVPVPVVPVAAVAAVAAVATVVPVATVSETPIAASTDHQEPTDEQSGIKKSRWTSFWSKLSNITTYFFRKSDVPAPIPSAIQEQQQQQQEKEKQQEKEPSSQDITAQPVTTLPEQPSASEAAQREPNNQPNNNETPVTTTKKDDIERMYQQSNMCTRCLRDGHISTECRARTYVNGSKLEVPKVAYDDTTGKNRKNKKFRKQKVQKKNRKAKHY